MKTIKLPSIGLEFALSEEDEKSLRAQLDEKTGRWRAEIGGLYYYLGLDNVVIDETEVKTSLDNNCYESKNYYQTREKAEMEVLRRQSIAEAWIPEEGDKFWYWNFKLNEPESIFYHNESWVPEFYIGICHKTQKECKEWAKKYAPAFEDILNK